MEPINQPPQWAPPAPPAPPAPKKERQWLIPTIGLAAVLVLAAGVGITVAATGDSGTATAATVPGGCTGVAPGKKFECDNGKWVYATPATTPRTTTGETTAETMARLIVDKTWDEYGDQLCDSMNEIVADGVPRSTAMQIGMTKFSEYDGIYRDEVIAAMRDKLESC